MISYNPKDWIRFIFGFHRADTFRKLFPLLLVIAGYSWLIAWLELEYFHLSQASHVRNLTLLHNLLGFAISMLLVFRTNTAYDRWWEGRRQWGSLVNASRNLAVKLAAILPESAREDRKFFCQLIPQYAHTLRMHLQSEQIRWELDEAPHPEFAKLDASKHPPSQVASLLMGRLFALQREGRITAEQLLFINTDVSTFLDVCGACERIKNTPIPFSYSGFIKKFIFIYILTLPLGYVFSLGYLVIPVVVFVFYVLASLEVIAEEIEDPFGKDSNDLPMEKMSLTIQRSVKDVLG